MGRRHSQLAQRGSEVMSNPPSPDDEDDASCLSYFSSFNRQSFETGDPSTAEAAAQHDSEISPSSRPSGVEKVPHPPMRSTLTPINVALPSAAELLHQQQLHQQQRKQRRRSGNRPQAAETPPPKAPSPTNPFALNTGPIASLISQHHHSLQTQLRQVVSQSPAIPTIVLQPVLMNLTQEQQLVAARLQEQFFGIVSNAGQNGQGPLAVVAPNLQSLTSPSYRPPL
jgi:hypothetical protein